VRTAFSWAIPLAAALTVVQAQTEQSASPVEPVRTYTLLAEDEDWSFLKDPSLREDVWDPLKYIPLGTEGSYLSIGGGVRQALEQVGNDNWGKQRYTNTFFLQRYVLHTDWHFGKHFRAYVELKSGLESFRKGGPRPIDEKRLDFEEAFVELSAGERNRGIDLDLGRLELNYGSGRLVSVREGPNVRQSFDGARLKTRYGAWRIDLWAVRPDLDKFGFFDNVSDHSTAF
jgi:alginate export protein